MQDDLRRPARAARPGRRAARLHRRPRPGRGDPATRRVVPAAAGGRRAHRRRPRRRRRLGGARARRRQSGSGGIWSVAASGSMPRDGEQVGDQRPHLGEDDLGGEVAGALDVAVARPRATSSVADGGGGPAGAELVGDRVGRVGEVVEQGGVRRRDRLVPVGTPPRPGAPAPGCCAARSPAARPARPSPAPGRGGGAGTARSVRPRGPRRPRPGARRSARRWTGRRAAPRAHRSTSPSRMLSAAARSSAEILRTITPACSRGRRSGARGTTAAATSATPPPISASVHRVNAAPGVGSSVAHDDRLDRGLVDEQDALVEQQRGRHRQGDDQRDLPAARRRAPWSDHVADEHADGDADGDLGRPGAAAGRRTCRGSPRRRSGRRTRCGWPKTSVAIVHATPAAIAHWADLPGLRAQPGTPLAQRRAAARHRQLEVRGRRRAVARQVLARTTS